MDDVEKDLDLPASQILGLFNRAIRKAVQVFSSIQERAVGAAIVVQKDVDMQPMAKSMDQELVSHLYWNIIPSWYRRFLFLLKINAW